LDTGGTTESEDCDFVAGRGECAETRKDAAEIDRLKVWQAAVHHQVTGFGVSLVSSLGGLCQEEGVRGVKCFCVGIEGHS
jgi:hypothetical protein